MKEIKEITGMRGLASQAVIFFHFCAISPALQSGLISSVAVPLAWNSGVDFFFVLSGFLLAVPFMQMKKIDLRAYYLKRCLRILPAYYVSMLFIVLFLSRHVTSEDILATVFFGQNFFQSTFTSINGVYWTLAIEEIFYATLPLFAILFVKGRWMFALPACVAFSTGYREVVYTLYRGQLQYLNFYLWQYPSYVEHYAIGVTLAALFVTGRSFYPGKLKNSYGLLATIVALGLTEYFMGVRYEVRAYDLPLANLVFAIEYGCLLYFTLASPLASRLRAVFTNKVSLFTGKLSYSTYVWHLPIEVTMYSLGLPVVEWVMLSYLAIIGVAALSYHLVEQPFLSLKNRIPLLKEKSLVGAMNKPTVGPIVKGLRNEPQ